MPLFRRRGSEPNRHPVQGFWDWWATDGHRIDPHTVSAMTDELSRRVARVHPDLAWHFGAGTTSRHCLTEPDPVSRTVSVW